MKRKRIRALLLSTALMITQLPMVIIADDFETENTLVKSITDWTFINDEQLNNGNLNLHDISKENQFSFDEVVAMLPTAINAYIEDETSPSTIGIVGWSCDPFIQDPEDNWPLIGDYTFVAELANGYTLASEAAAIEVKVLLSGTNTYAENNYIEQYGIKIIYDNGGAATYTEGSGFTLTKDGSYIISGTWSGSLSASAYNSQFVITVPFGVTANITLNSVIIDVNSTDYAGAFLVAAGGEANIALDGMNILISGNWRAGLEVPENATLTLKGGDSDSLEATGGGSGFSGAGIGGGESANSGKIAINGGNITANGASGSAGIGGGSCTNDNGGSGGTITISDGTVIANGSNGGAGIGGGSGVNGGSGGTIIIRDGTVTATGGDGAGIGGGSGDANGVLGGGDGDKITISGGSVTATSSSGAGIGGGGNGYGFSGGSGGTVEIFGQDTTVTVNSSYGYDVGSGKNNYLGGSLSVTDGATLIMKNNGTNVSNPIYQNCTIIDKNGNRTEYDSNGNIIPTSSSGSYTPSIPKDSYKISGNSINQSITRTNLRRLANAGKSLTLESDLVVMSFDPAALKAILANTTGSKVTFTAMPADLSKSPEIKTIIDSHPAYDFLSHIKTIRALMYR